MTVAAAALLCLSHDAALGENVIVPDVHGEVTLAQAVATALARSPELSAASADVGIREALVLQAGLRPNPSVGVDVQDVGGYGDRKGWESGQTTLTVSQPLELGGKRARRRRAAELERDVVYWEVEVRRRNLVAEVTRAFVATLVAQERLRVLDELVGLATDSVRSVSATVEAGAVSPVERTRAEVQVGRAQAARLAAERELTAARSQLASTWGSPQPSFSRVTGALEPLATPQALETLLPHIPSIPDLTRLETELEQRRAALALERARRVPDLTLTAGVRHFGDNDDGALVFGFSVPLPLFDNNRGNILAASRAVSKATLERRAGEITAETRARQAHAALVASFQQATVLRERTIPEARRAYEGAKDAYIRGLFRYLEVLDAQRTLFEIRSDYLNVLAGYYEASAELSRWVTEADDMKMHNIEGDDHD